MFLKELTKFFSEILVFVHEVIHSHLKLVDLFGYGLCLKVSHFNLIFTLFDLCDGCFQAINALLYRNRAVITHTRRLFPGPHTFCGPGLDMVEDKHLACGPKKRVDHTIVTVISMSIESDNGQGGKTHKLCVWKVSTN